MKDLGTELYLASDSEDEVTAAAAADGDDDDSGVLRPKLKYYYYSNPTCSYIKNISIYSLFAFFRYFQTHFF